MAVADQLITENYALYLGDCMEVLPTIPDDSIHLSVYSPPFGGLYHYSSSERDLSNSDDYEGFFEHYAYVIRELYRVTLPGRISAVHCMEIPSGNSGLDWLTDFPGHVIQAHEEAGWRYVARYAVWKEPLGVRNRTMAKNLMHQTVVENSTRAANAVADYLVVFRKRGESSVPVTHEHGLMSYAGSRQMPTDLLPYKGWQHKQTGNLYSHWIWRQYASSFWDDIRPDRVLPFQSARDEEDEKHVHPLQLDIIERIVTLWSNPGDTVLTPFMGVGSEAWGALTLGRKALGIELKPSYYQQAIRNLELAHVAVDEDQLSFLDQLEAAS